MAGDEGGRLNACTKNIQIYISLYMSLCISIALPFGFRSGYRQSIWCFFILRSSNETLQVSPRLLTCMDGSDPYLLVILPGHLALWRNLQNLSFSQEGQIRTCREL